MFIASCSTDSGSFRLKGKFKNFKYGELYVYSLEGRGKIDTIRLADGKFTYETAIDDTVTMSIVFPNFSEIPVIASPGSSITMEGDASHLREVVVKGSDDNEQLTQFRLSVNNQMPPEAVKSAAMFIKENPTSPACGFILNKYFLLKTDANWTEAEKLLNILVKANPGNKRFSELKKQVAGLRVTKKDDQLPKFSAVSMAGQRVSNVDLKGELNVISSWTSWNFDSQSIQRQLRKKQNEYGKQRLGLLSICLDGNPSECRKTVERDSMLSCTICDGQMWDMPIVSLLGIQRIPDIIVCDRKGQIIARGISQAELIKEIDQKLGDGKESSRFTRVR